MSRLEFRPGGQRIKPMPGIDPRMHEEKRGARRLVFYGTHREWR